MSAAPLVPRASLPLGTRLGPYSDALCCVVQPGLTSLAVHDPEMFALIQEEEKRQRECIELIASEVRMLPRFWRALCMHIPDGHVVWCMAVTLHARVAAFPLSELHVTCGHGVLGLCPHQQVRGGPATRTLLRW